MQYYILLLYYIVEYTLHTNNGIIFMLFISFITFIYTFYCYSFITRLFAFAFVGDAVGDRYKPIIYQVIRLSGSLHCFLLQLKAHSGFRLQARRILLFSFTLLPFIPFHFLQFVPILHLHCSSFAPAFRYATFICFCFLLY